MNEPDGPLSRSPRGKGLVPCNRCAHHIGTKSPRFNRPMRAWQTHQRDPGRHAEVDSRRSFFCCGPLDLRAQAVLRSARRTDIHEGVFVKTKEQDEHGTAQTSIRHHPQQRSAMRPYAVAPLHTSGVLLRPVGSSGCNLSPALDLDVAPADPRTGIGYLHLTNSYRFAGSPSGRPAPPGPTPHRGLGPAGRRGPKACQAIAPGLGPAGSSQPGRGRHAPPPTARRRETVTAPDTLPGRQRLPT
jgi:hypothetical protein